MRKALLMGIVAGLVLSMQTLCPAQKAATESSAGQMKPLLTVALSSYDRIISDVRAISPPSAMTVEGLLNAVSGGQGLEGLDKKRPMGLLLRTDGQQILLQETLVFVPVKDLPKLLKALEPSIGETEEKDGVFEVNAKDQTIFLKQAGDWTYISMSSDGLAKLPKNPLEALEGLDKDYDLGIRVSVQDIPQAYRQLLVGFIQMAGQQSLQQRPDESEEEQQLRAKAFEQSIKQMTQVLNELDKLVLGIKIDDKTGSALLDFVTTAVKGSDLAKQYTTAAEPVETKFAGFLLEGAAISVSAAQKIPQTNLEQVKSSMATARAGALKDLENQDLSEEDLALAKEITNQLFEVVENTLKGGLLDMGASVKVGPEAATVVAGMRVLDTEKIDTMLKKLAEKVAKEDAKVAEAIKLNAAEYEGVHFHRISVPTEAIPTDGEVDLSKLVGKSLDAFIGIGKESVYLGVGRDALETVKKAIDKSKEARKIPPMQLTITAMPLIEFVGSVAKDDEVTSVINILTQVLKGNPGKDHLIITSTVIPDGGKMRIEVQEGILKLLGALPMVFAGR